MKEKPKVKLVGEDGNALAIIGRCKREAKKFGWTNEQVSSFIEDATAGDYKHLLKTVCEQFETDLEM